MDVQQKVTWLGLAGVVLGVLLASPVAVGPVEVLIACASGVAVWLAYRPGRKGGDRHPPTG